ncbi:hypothetical protein FSP39_004276 [Pinctada imbricata]|uniref:TLDc domain-containing protein n=1 Tax=Pinctada imbricata TaxID=66713 RepID=A0AA88YQI3_PINIB|nr:hypothetical protein FSP39_004276 [Pinctada imbricata]
MSSLLDRKDRKQLWEWIGKPSRFDLLYKASRDGCSASAFHTLCDDKGPTVTVLFNTEGSVFGGYTSQSWNGSGSYVSDSNAFLFRLKSKGHSKCSKFPVMSSSSRRVQYAIFCESSNGPTFGGGHDLNTFTGTVQKSNGYFALNGYCSYGSSYDMSGEDANTINDGHLMVKDIEVYTVKDGEDVGGLSETPWRAEPDWSNESLQMLKTAIRGYKPPKELEHTEVSILLLGQVAAGKSSLINTIQSVFRGEVSARARSGTAENSLTIKFNPLTAISPTSFGFIKSPNVKDKVHAVILVVDASTFDVMPEGIIAKIKDIQTVFNARDLPQVIFMTKIDKLCPDVSDDLTNVFRSETTFEVLSKISDCFGLPRGHIFPVKNYENETELDGNINILVLKALKQLLNFTDEYIEDQYGDLLCGSDSVHAKE